MKKNLHPDIEETIVSCSCGNTFTTLSVLGKAGIRVEICSKCHPFYTGKEKIIKAGAVDKFMARMKKTESMK